MKNGIEGDAFFGKTASFEKLALNEGDIKIITELGLTPEDLSQLLRGDHLAEGSYALIFEVPDSNPKLMPRPGKRQIMILIERTMKIEPYDYLRRKIISMHLR